MTLIRVVAPTITYQLLLNYKHKINTTPEGQTTATKVALFWLSEEHGVLFNSNDRQTMDLMGEQFQKQLLDMKQGHICCRAHFLLKLKLIQ